MGFVNYASEMRQLTIPSTSPLLSTLGRTFSPTPTYRDTPHTRYLQTGTPATVLPEPYRARVCNSHIRLSCASVRAARARGAAKGEGERERGWHDAHSAREMGEDDAI